MCLVYLSTMPRCLGLEEWRKASLPPPPASSITAEQYFRPPRAPAKHTASNTSKSKRASEEKKQPQSDLDAYLHLGRPMVQVLKQKTFSCKVEMCDDFPFSIQNLDAILGILAPHQPHVVCPCACVSLSNAVLFVFASSSCSPSLSILLSVRASI